MAGCIFCKIIAGEIPCKKVYEDDKILCFYDVSPAAPVHVLVIPKEHIPCAFDISPQNSGIIANIFEAITGIAQTLKLENGFRIVNNCREDGGQTVDHLHFHVIGGRQMAWPPG